MSSIGRKKILLEENIELWALSTGGEELSWTPENGIHEGYVLQPKSDYYLHAKGSNSETITFISSDFWLKVDFPNKSSSDTSSTSKLLSEKGCTLVLFPAISSEELEHQDRRLRLVKRERKALWGTTRSLLVSNLRAASQGISLNLSLRGIGFKAFIQENGKDLLLKLGYSHELRFKVPEGLQVKVSADSGAGSGGGEGQRLTLEGNNLQKVRDFADLLRRARPPEPYKGKGVIWRTFRDENKVLLMRKQGKQKNSLFSGGF